MSKDQEEEVFSLCGRPKFVDVIEAWAAKAVPMIFLFWGGSRSDTMLRCGPRLSCEPQDALTGRELLRCDPRLLRWNLKAVTQLGAIV